MMMSDDKIGALFIFGAPRSGTTQLLRLCKDMLQYVGGVEGCIWQSVKALDDHFRRVLLQLDGVDGDGTKDFAIVSLSREKIVAEYALRNNTTPIGISAYQITEALPEALKGSLPSVEQLEAELARSQGEDESG